MNFRCNGYTHSPSHTAPEKADLVADVVSFLNGFYGTDQIVASGTKRSDCIKNTIALPASSMVESKKCYTDSSALFGKFDLLRGITGAEKTVRTDNNRRCFGYREVQLAS
jgi:hypothetical protein